MTLTKTECKKLRSYKKRAEKIEHSSEKLAKDVSRELKRQMKKS